MNSYNIYDITPIDQISTSFPYGFCAKTSGAKGNSQKNSNIQIYHVSLFYD